MTYLNKQLIIIHTRAHTQEFKSLRDQRTNEVLYTLTIVTTLFVPLQFLTGVYGYVCNTRVCVCVYVYAALGDSLAAFTYIRANSLAIDRLTTTQTTTTDTQTG